MSNSRDHSRYLLGLGLVLRREYSLRADTVIRPVHLNSSIEHIEKITSNQVDYGFLCSLSNKLSFELEIVANSEKEAAVRIWNAQWDLILLSILSRTPVFWPFSSTSSSASGGSGVVKLSNLFFGRHPFSKPKQISERDIEIFIQLETNFHKLLKASSFVHAASVASTNYTEPKPSIRMVAIWSAIEALLGFDHELRFRIAVAVARLLEVDEQARQKRFNEVKKLYDLRSKSVHGVQADKDAVDAAVDQSQELLCKLLEFFIRKGALLSKPQMEALFLE